jgi:hypothetical protein
MCLQIIHRSFGLVLHLLFQVSINVIGQYILQLREGINRYNNGVPGNSLLTFVRCSWTYVRIFVSH